MDEFSQLPDQLIEEALEQRPYAQLPSGFVNRVMAQIPGTPQPIRYRLELLDVALPALVTCLIALALGLTGRLVFLGITPPISWPASPILSLPTAWASLNSPGLIGLLVFAEICVVALFCVWYWLDRPADHHNPYWHGDTGKLASSPFTPPS